MSETRRVGEKIVRVLRREGDISRLKWLDLRGREAIHDKSLALNRVPIWVHNHMYKQDSIPEGLLGKELKRRRGKPSKMRYLKRAKLQLSQQTLIDPGGKRNAEKVNVWPFFNSFYIFLCLFPLFRPLVILIDWLTPNRDFWFEDPLGLRNLSLWCLGHLPSECSQSRYISEAKILKKQIVHVLRYKRGP